MIYIREQVGSGGQPAGGSTAGGLQLQVPVQHQWQPLGGQAGNWSVKGLGEMERGNVPGGQVFFGQR